MKNIMKKEIEMAELYAVIVDDQDKVKIDESQIEVIKNSVAATLEYENFEGPAEVNITFVDNIEIKELNNQYRRIDKATDVLSFPLSDNGIYDINYSNGAKELGDIVLSVEKALEQSIEYGHSFIRELSFLTVHSTLHLLGYDHVNSEEEEKEMFRKQDEIMEILNINR